jgi:hypothetical protein
MAIIPRLSMIITQHYVIFWDGNDGCMRYSIANSYFGVRQAVEYTNHRIALRYDSMRVSIEKRAEARQTLEAACREGNVDIRLEALL